MDCGFPASVSTHPAGAGFARKVRGEIIFCDICRVAALTVVHLSSERSWRGGEQQMAYLIENLIPSGVKVAVLARENSAFEKWCADRDIDLYTAGFRIGPDLSTALKLKRVVRDLGADLVHVHSGKSHTIAWLAASLGMRAPIVVHRRVDFPLSGSPVKLAKYNHPSVKKIICVSDAIADLIRSKVARPERVARVYSGIDFTRFDGPNTGSDFRKENGIPEGALLVGNVSALAPHKDYYTWIRTAKRVAEVRDDVYFVAVGEGGLTEEIKAAAAEAGIEKRVVFTGFRKDVPDLLPQFDIFLITSETEGLGTGIIDAMYCRLPVVATRAGGIPELVVPDKTGFLCEVGDDICLAKRVVQLLDAPALRQRFGKEGRARAELFSGRDMAAAVVKIYSELGD